MDIKGLHQDYIKVQFLSFFNFVCGCVLHAHVRAHIDTVPAELGLGLQVVVSHSAWVLGAELRPF